MFEQTAGRLQLDINSLLVNLYIHTDRYVGNEGIYIVPGHCVRPLGRMHTILVCIVFQSDIYVKCIRHNKVILTLTLIINIIIPL